MRLRSPSADACGEKVESGYNNIKGKRCSILLGSYLLFQLAAVSGIVMTRDPRLDGTSRRGRKMARVHRERPEQAGVPGPRTNHPFGPPWVR